MFLPDLRIERSTAYLQIIVTSYLFPNATFALDRLQVLCSLVGKEKLVVDLSCRKREQGWVVAMNGWKTLTDTHVTQGQPHSSLSTPHRLSTETISTISQYCSELLIHAADVEGLCQGIDEDLVSALGEWCEIPVTYAGGAREIGDLDLVDRLSHGRVDLTFGS